MTQIANNMVDSLEASLPIHVGGPLDGLRDWSKAEVSDNESEEEALLEGLRQIYEETRGRKSKS